jgi:hypothetical protein
MGNSSTRTISYRPRLTQEEAFDLLPPELRSVYRSLVTEFDTASILRFYQKHGITKTKQWLRQGEDEFLRRGFIRRTIARPKVESTAIALGIEPLRTP